MKAQHSGGADGKMAQVVFRRGMLSNVQTMVLLVEDDEAFACAAARYLESRQTARVLGIEVPPVCPNPPRM
jgi:hypothetical protein